MPSRARPTHSPVGGGASSPGGTLPTAGRIGSRSPPWISALRTAPSASTLSVAMFMPAMAEGERRASCRRSQCPSEGSPQVVRATMERASPSGRRSQREPPGPVSDCVTITSTRRSPSSRISQSALTLKSGAATTKRKAVRDSWREITSTLRSMGMKVGYSAGVVITWRTRPAATLARVTSVMRASGPASASRTMNAGPRESSGRSAASTAAGRGMEQPGGGDVRAGRRGGSALRGSRRGGARTRCRGAPQRKTQERGERLDGNTLVHGNSGGW
ncbi:MAG: hypothetical protein IPF99_08485 [Deltaproteobacteria bacterium]|nr:hypothetical protein [Deltaproteobacteria bacterium]